MSKTLNLEWSVSRMIFDPAQDGADEPDRGKVLAAISILTTKHKGIRAQQKLNEMAVAAILPIQLEVNIVSDEIFVDAPPRTIDLTSENSDFELSAVDDGSKCHLSMSYSVRFSVQIHDDVTEERYEEWSGWDWVGIPFATGCYVCDNGSQMSWSIDDE